MFILTNICHYVAERFFFFFYSDVQGEVKSLRDIDAQLLYEACVKGLRTINSNLVFNSTMPRNNASKVNAATQVMKALQDSGLRADMSYSALMYPNEGDTRTILMWLNQNVKTGVSVDASATAKDNLSIESLVAGFLKRQTTRPWAPVAFPSSSGHTTLSTRPLSAVPLRSSNPKEKEDAKTTEYVSKHMPFACDQVPHVWQRSPSLLQQNALQLSHQREQILQRNDPQQQGNAAQRRARIANVMAGKLRLALQQQEFNEFLLMPLDSRWHRQQNQKGLMSRFIRQRNQLGKADVAKAVKSTTGMTTEEEAKEKREKELAELEERLKRLAEEIQAARSAIGDLISVKRQLEADAVALQLKAAEVDKARGEIEMVRRLMQDPEGNRAKLQQITQANAAKLMEAAQKWEPKRQQLLAAYRAEKDKMEARKEAAKGLLEEIEGMRTKAKDLAQDIQQRDQRYRQLLEEWQRMEKAGGLANRQYHTDKILEGQQNVRKQNADIDKVLLDTRELQREIAQLTDTLSRSFTIVDELVFHDAKSDEAAKTAYRLLVAMNEKFNQLIESVRSSVQTRNAILELERSITDAKLRTDTLDLERVQQDLNQLKAENTQLAVRVASIK